ncbi:MAG: type II secretion system protein GspK [Longimicrobiales bacterium]
MTRESADRRSGTVLLAALVFLAILATVVTSQLARLPFEVAESRGAVASVRRGVAARSARVLAAGILRSDGRAGETDGFGDSWVRPHAVRVGGCEVEVRLSDWPVSGLPEDAWLRHEFGIPEGVSLLSTGDPYVLGLFRQVRPNVNTAPLTVLARRAGLSRGVLEWLKERREQMALERLEDLEDAPDADEAMIEEAAEELTCGSRLFLAQAVIREDGGPERRRYWVLQRDGTGAHVVYSGPEEVLR